MRVYVCRLVFHESLYYATREVGRLYETEGCLHNYALTYALGLAAAPYFQAQQVPHYVEELTPLNERGIYITPARGVEVQYTLRRLAITTYPAFVRCSRYCKAWRRQIGQVILARLPRVLLDSAGAAVVGGCPSARSESMASPLR